MVRILLRRLVLLALFVTACSPQESPSSPIRSIRVGYFANITHAQALIGLARGDFQNALGSIKIETSVFNAGPSVIEALFAGKIDLAYIGPNPAINGYVQSQGQALRIVAGATSGGAAFIVRREANINVPADLAGKKLASPQLGNTQDVALRNFIVTSKLNTREKGGTVEVVPTANSQILDLFRQGKIDGAWVPEPWASRLIVEANGKLFIDERTLWRGGDFVTAHIIVSTNFLRANPKLVKAWLAAHVRITEWASSHTDEAAALLNAEIEKLTGYKLQEQVLKQAWSHQRLTWDPISSSLIQSADSAFAAGFLLEKPNLEGIYDLALLNQVLDEAKLPRVDAGLK